jgi:hypothetical protein
VLAVAGAVSAAPACPIQAALGVPCLRAGAAPGTAPTLSSAVCSCIRRSAPADLDPGSVPGPRRTSARTPRYADHFCASGLVRPGRRGPDSMPISVSMRPKAVDAKDSASYSLPPMTWQIRKGKPNRVHPRSGQPRAVG